MRYIPDMGLATMRTGCGRNKTYAPSGSQQQPLTEPKKTPYMPVGHIRSFLWSKSVCAGSCRPPVFSRSIRKGTEVSLCLSRHRRLSVPVRICRAVPCRRPWRRRGGIRSGAAREDVPEGCPGKRDLPFIRYLGREPGHYSLLFREGIRPPCPALPEGNTLLYPTF